MINVICIIASEYYMKYIWHLAACITSVYLFDSKINNIVEFKNVLEA